jgi:Mn2+/Fe2+ NRAMP family transporter
VETELKNTYETSDNPPVTLRERLKFVGPGIALAATGVGAGDLAVSIIAGSGFGLTLFWAILAGALIKFFLTEGVGRWYLSTGKTIFQGWHLLGWWATAYFAIYLVLFGIIYGAAVTAVFALIMTAMFPGTPFWLWAMSSAVAGFFLVWFGSYRVLEKVMMALIGLMVVTVIGSAVMILANLGDVSYGVVPSIPEGSFFRILGIIGGVGGTLALVYYGYWLQAKGWKGKQWMPIMKTDVFVAYAVTAIFSIAVMIIAAELLFGTGIRFNGNDALFGLANAYEARFGGIARWILLLGFGAAVFTSIIGPWHGVSYLFADFVRICRNKGKEVSNIDEPVSEKDPAYRVYLAWLTFPPMLLLLFQKPVEMVLLYGIISALFAPFLTIVLSYLLNSKWVDPGYRNGKVYNIIFGLIILLFVYLGANELYHTIF